jgi:hypothetical protein
MIRSRLLSATVAAMIGISACDGHGSSLPTAPSISATISPIAIGASPSFSKSSSRRGVLHATKECSEYRGLPGSFCTITSSNLKQIEVGSRVVYASAPANGKLDSDLILDLPGPGNNIAFGHVTLDLTTTPPHGLVTFSGGTGKFRHFQATVVVSPLNGGPDWNWDGPYSFSDKDDGGNEGGDQH